MTTDERKNALMSASEKLAAKPESVSLATEAQVAAYIKGSKQRGRVYNAVEFAKLTMDAATEVIDHLFGTEVNKDEVANEAQQAMVASGRASGFGS